MTEDDRVSEEFLVELVKREPMLALLCDGPREMNELVSALEMSRSTVHRATRSFAEKGLLRDTDDGYELTGFGRTVAAEVVDFRSVVGAADRLEAFLNTVGATDADVPVEAFTDATVVHPKPRQPHFAVKRIIELIEEADEVQLFSSIISPFYVDVAYREMLNGTEIEAVFDSVVVEIIASEYTEKATRAAETGQFDVFVHENIPFELFVFDDCIGMAAHDDGGIARVFVETEAPRAVEWAENVYDSYRDSANHVDMETF